jgi:transcriptional regulator with XRE-family HTH domain
LIPYLNIFEESIMTLGERIKLLRERRGWSLRELSREADVPHNTLSQLERGLRADVTTETAKRLARALQVSVDYLIGMYEEEQDSELQPTGVVLVGA